MVGSMKYLPLIATLICLLLAADLQHSGASSAPMLLSHRPRSHDRPSQHEHYYRYNPNQPKEINTRNHDQNHQTYREGHFISKHEDSFKDITYKEQDEVGDHIPLRDSVEFIPNGGEFHQSELETQLGLFTRSNIEANLHSVFRSDTIHQEQRNSIENEDESQESEETSEESQSLTSSKHNVLLNVHGLRSSENVISKSSKEYKVVCYLESWAVKRPIPLNFDISDIDPFACTHIIYAFAQLNSNSLTIEPLDENRDIAEGSYQRAIDLKKINPSLKILIALGGWTEGGSKFSKMVSTPETRKVFLESLSRFMEQHAFDGIDINWEYPGATDRGGKGTDKENLSILCDQIKSLFSLKDLILTMALPIAEVRIEDGYDLTRLSKCIDFFNLMSYDLRGPWDGLADHHAPIAPRNTDKYIHKGLNLKAGIQLLIDRGVPRRQLIVGIPLYGRSFTLEREESVNPGARISGMGREGPYTREKSYIAFFEVCVLLRNGGWKVMKDEAGGTYMYKGSQWIGYDDEEYVAEKVKLMRKESLGGMMVWAMDLDDYLGMCGKRWPILSTIRRVLKDSEELEEPDIFLKSKPSETSGIKDSEIMKNHNLSRESKRQNLEDFLPSHKLMDTSLKEGNYFICSRDGYFRHSSSCNTYYVCSDNITKKFRCPNGMMFDLSRRNCNWKNLVQCREGFAPLKKTKKMKCTEDGLFSHPIDCKKYIWCKKRKPNVHECPNELYYNSRTGACTSLENNFCLHGEMLAAPADSFRRIAETRPSLQSRSEDYKIVCYFSSWAWLRPDLGIFVPESIDPNLCTHVIYAFAILDPVELEIRSPDTWTDLDNGFYQRVLSLKEKGTGLKVMLSLGGWTDSSGDKYSRLVNNPEARSKFVLHTVALLKAYGFDGLDLHWEYPVCWQIDCKRGPSSDKQGFAALVRELHQAFLQQPVPLLLSAAVSSARGIISRAYDMQTLSANLDFINVMTYDYHGFWEKTTGHVAPLYHREGDIYESQNADFSINYLIGKGANPRKLVMGIPFYGQTFTLAYAAQNSINDPVVGPGKSGPITLQKGMLSYVEICETVRQPGWKKATDNTASIGPFATKDNQWISYDDPKMISVKANYIKTAGLGGAMVWTIDFDDFHNLCCSEPFPLLRALNRILRIIPYPKPRPGGGDCSRPQHPVTPPPPVTVTTYAGAKQTRPTTDFGELLINVTGYTTPTTWKTSTTLSPTTWNTPTPRPTSPSTKRTTHTTMTTTTTVPWWWTKPTKPTTHPMTSKTTTKATAVMPPSKGGQKYPGVTCDGTSYFSHPKDCSKFLRCVGGKLAEASCISGLHWNQRLQICDWPDNAMCRKAIDSPNKATTTRPTTKKTTPQTTKSTTHRITETPKTTRLTTKRLTTTTSKSTPSTPTSYRPRPPTKRCQVGETRGVPGDCTKYAQCVGSKFINRPCPPGLEWNSPKRICDWKIEAQCSIVMRVTGHNSVEVGSAAAHTLSAPSGKRQASAKPGGSCDPSNTIFARSPTSCQAFLICNQGKYEEKHCFDGLFWNDEKHICDWSQNVKCKGSPETIVASDPEILPPAPAPAPSVPSPVVDPPFTVTSPYQLEKVTPSGVRLAGDFKVVCYFTNWAWYRPDMGKYSPDDIDDSICTHIIYGFAVLDYSELIIKPHDVWADIDNNFYQKVTSLKTKGIKVSVAIGGWNDSEGDKYSRLVNNPASRARFITHVIEFIKRHNFDGLDFDWEYPVCWQVKCREEAASDKKGFADFMAELSEAFRPQGFLLSAAVSPSKKVIDLGYDVPTLSKHLDWIAVMAYDFHGHWDKKTGHVAPMYYHPDDDFDYFNMDFAIRYWIERGADNKKIVLGMPLYGQSFTLDNPSVNGINSPANQKGLAGQYTRAAGFLAYYEICESIQQGWTVIEDSENSTGPYAFKGKQWVSFDNVATIRRKAQYIRDNKLGGGMIWALDLDDFSGRCNQGKHPLMNTIKNVLGSLEQPLPPPIHKVKGKKPSSNIVRKPIPRPIESGVTSGTSTEPHGYKVVCYYTNWSWYRQGEGKFHPEDVDPTLCTHINYGFAVLNRNTFLIKPHDSWADIDNNFYRRIIELKSKGIKVLIALGGWNDSAGGKYSELANDVEKRRQFNQNVLEFIQKYNFDGLDLDWEYPKCWQVDCNKGPSSDKQAFSDWLMELKTLFEPYGLLLTAAVSPNKKVIDAGYDVPVLSKYLDIINVMAYDYHGQWDKKTGHLAPMYSHPEDDILEFNTNYTINYWINQGADPKKIILGMPLYGQSFTLSSPAYNGLNQKTYGGGDAGPYTRARGFMAYYEICYFIKNNGWKVTRDKYGTMGPYAYKGNTWISFDDIPQIKYKSNYIKSMGLGGAMIWALDLDDFTNRCGCGSYPLLKTINNELRGGTYQEANSCPLLGDDSIAEIPLSLLPYHNISSTDEAVPEVAAPSRPEKQQLSQVEESLGDNDVAVAAAKPTQIGYGIAGEDCTDAEFKRHSSCEKFLECFKGKLREISCGPGLHWDGKRACRLPHEAKCPTSRISGQSIVTKVKPLASKPIASKPLASKPIVAPTLSISPAVAKKTSSNLEIGTEGELCQIGDFKRHKECSKFFECNANILKERRCFPGLHWNGKGRCDYPNRANCKQIKRVDLPPTLPTTVKTTPSEMTSYSTLPSTESTTTRHWRPPTTEYSTTRQWTIPTTESTTTWHWTPSSTTSARESEETTTKIVWWTPSTKEPIEIPTHKPGSLETDGFKVVCYFTNWAWYRQGLAKYKPEDIDENLCTHIIYGFAVLNPNTLTIKPHDSWADIDNRFYEKVTMQKKYGTRVLVALGGWNDSLGDKYSRLANDPAARRVFIEHAIEFIKKWNFDGLDLDWEYPKCWQVDCSKGPDSDKEAFTALIGELHEAFQPYNWLLTAALSPSYKVIPLAYDIPALNRYLDFFSVMTYDYHGHWDKATGHVAPLFDYPESPDHKFNANFTINYYLEQGADRQKIVMGIPLYGQAFSLRNSSNIGLNAMAQKGIAGKYTRAAGFLAYYEICNLVLEGGYTLVRDPLGSIGPYAYKGNQWVGFDDTTMLRSKANFIRQMGLGGGMVWALDLDDFNNRCGCEPHPLLRTIRRVLRRDYPQPAIRDCSLS